MNNIFSEILQMSVDSVWLIFAVIVVRGLLRKSPMYFRKILWGLVGVRLLLPFSFESVFSLLPHTVPQTTDKVVEQVVSMPVEQGVSFMDAVAVVWIVGCISFLIYGVISYIRLKFKVIDGVLVEDNVYHSDKIDSPFVCGFIKPKIYLPYGLDDVTGKCVLQHEKNHIRFADHIIKGISFVVLCIHWFNPLVWIAYFLLCKDIELACDESVIKKYNETECKQYAKALLELGVNKVKFTACPVAFGELSIKKRIKSVINYKKAGKILVIVSVCLCVIVAICFMTEPSVKAKESETIQPVVEKETQQTTETTTQEGNKENTHPMEEETEFTTEYSENVKVSVDEFVTKPATEPVTEVVTEIVTEPYYEKETQSQFIYVEQPAFVNSFVNTYYKEPDLMHNKAVEAGVFANEEEKVALIDVLQQNNASLEENVDSDK